MNFNLVLHQGRLIRKWLQILVDVNSSSQSMSEKPDIVVWCDERKVVPSVDLTVPQKDNIDEAHMIKNDRYRKLLEEYQA